MLLLSGGAGPKNENGDYSWTSTKFRSKFPENAYLTLRHAKTNDLPFISLMALRSLSSGWDRSWPWTLHLKTILKCPAALSPTSRQREYLEFIKKYMLRFGISPAESDIQRHFLVSAPSVNSMVQALERHGFIMRQRGMPRSIRLVDATDWQGLWRYSPYEGREPRRHNTPMTQPCGNWINRHRRLELLKA